MMKTHTYFDQILGSFELPRPKRHTPRFRLVREQGNWRVFDGDKALALFMPLMLDIWSFSPFEPDEIANVEPPGKVVDLHTVHNTVINFASFAWPKHWFVNGDAEKLMKWTWLKTSGRELAARLSVAGPDGESAQWLLRVRYDAAWGRYRYTWDIDVRKFEPETMEAFNMMLAGALTERAASRRWTHSIWENPDGELRRIVHSNALFFCTDYASGVKLDEGGPWRARQAPYPRAWVGYAAHPSFNPAMLVHRTNVPVSFGICSQLFDEHLSWIRAFQDNLDANGYFHFQSSVELVNLKPALAREFLRRAKDPMKPRRWHHHDVALPLQMDQVNSFAAEIDPWQPEECMFVKVPRTATGPVVWDRTVGHSDRCSIRLTASGSTERRELFPGGAVCRVRPHHRYRLTGWIKTRAVKRFARLELAAYEYSYTNITATANSPAVAGSRDWTQVAVELDSDDEAYLMPKLVLYGAGSAWFDDVELTEVS